ncbi:hypothetical protein CEQ90_13770 [Lewinellaceae bacterium SD302]|nr:hypothetical protein CEQ90_13770 [Lewinellaceae bacterium SD302]
MKNYLPLILLLCLSIVGCDRSRPETFSAKPLPSPVFPQAEWQLKQPAELGVNDSILQEAMRFLAGHCKEDGLEETMVIRNGYLIFAGDSIDKVHDIWSCTKSFTSAAAGMLAAEGKLQLDDYAADYEELLTEKYPKVTIRHFLTMTNGYNAEGQSRWNEPSEDWSHTPYVPANPLFEPGTAYTYWDEAMIMFGRVLTRAAGESLNDYLRPRLFDPIGIEPRAWWGEGMINDSTKINFGGTGLRMSASEHSRFGLLMLNQGNWEGQQLLDATFVAAAISNQVPGSMVIGDTDRKSTGGRGIYGYNWWVINEGTDAPVAAAFTSGLNHNVCLVVPAWKMVIVRMGMDGNPEAGKHFVYSELLKRLEQGIE